MKAMQEGMQMPVHGRFQVGFRLTGVQGLATLAARHECPEHVLRVHPVFERHVCRNITVAVGAHLLQVKLVLLTPQGVRRSPTVPEVRRFQQAPGTKQGGGIHMF
ncbi:hypothetical protein GCM10008938_50600 [Deinococcus roseus]|uniref:Uncharacterized protein n=1 Tax=Deinococcus roseus TaxID=392414 RepID=A0ABQ2DK69_9DEIO|nr:hypothetical protein GCM10008938_50600 [Deinococcus roseus]